ncbi:hypothetical protein SAMN06295974_1448 [Plantibacter flavus]|uniref:Uncharacterized protein n=1 Tax=Plantibacter flavus TaxID=150123 RepID=A0A3N2C7I5_9MICO|nr:hypothetical protein [Plantibacter flavus]ROR83380.1 hypothetical protein EDD42_3491 [Plantibacter flavus]SMG22986.1 hypothetical protein SAMN06295974_1448 [Plantibacter flavus]
MESLTVVLVVVGVAFVVLSVLVLALNHRRQQRDARRRQEQHGDEAARHAGGYRSQRGRVYRSGSTNHQQTPDSW